MVQSSNFDNGFGFVIVSKKKVIMIKLQNIFYLTGGRLYLDYLLPTNPRSRTAVFRQFCRWIGVTDLYRMVGDRRIVLAVWLTLVHSLLSVWMTWLALAHEMFDHGDMTAWWVLVMLYVNVYPMWVQVYVALMYRRYKRIKS